MPIFKAPNEASVFFHDSAVSITLLSLTAIYESPYIQSVPSPGPGKNGIENTQWPMVGILTFIYGTRLASSTWEEGKRTAGYGPGEEMIGIHSPLRIL